MVNRLENDGEADDATWKESVNDADKMGGVSDDELQTFFELSGKGYTPEMIEIVINGPDQESMDAVDALSIEDLPKLPLLDQIALDALPTDIIQIMSAGLDAGKTRQEIKDLVRKKMGEDRMSN